MSELNNNTSGQNQHPILGGIYASPLTASVISKLVSQPTSIASSGIRDAKAGAEASRGELVNASMEIQKTIRDAENGISLFPDIELSIQTVVSSILAPNNMTQEEFQILLEHPNLPPDIAAEIVELVKEEVNGFYELDDKLYRIIENALFKQGSHVELILPESAVDHLINERPNLRVESIGDLKRIFNTVENTSMGILGPVEGKDGLRFESYTGLELQKPLGEDSLPLSNLITVGDNFGKLKLPGFKKEMAKLAMRNKVRNIQKLTREVKKDLGPRLESINTRAISDNELKSSVYKTSPSGSELFLRIPDRDNLKRHSIGRPLKLTPPSECWLPVHYPGNPEEHIGAFALVDQDGYFLSMESQRKFIMASQTHLNAISSNTTAQGSNTSNVSSSLLEKAKQNIKGTDTTIPLNYLAEIFGTLLEEDLLKRIRNGIFSTEAAISRNNNIYAVMLARALSGSQTQIIFIPKEFFTYFAFQYNNNGTGRSLLTDVGNLISLRAVSMYAKIANQIRNAISITDVNIELDPKDPNPKKTLEKIVDLTSQTRTQFFPWGLNTPSDIANWWHRAGFQMHVTGHPGISATKIEYSQRTHDKNTPQVDEDNQLNDMIHMHFGVTPEMRDAGFGAQFATSIANNNILFSKRIMQYQKTANKLLSDYVRVISNNDSFISNKIRKIIKEKWAIISSKFEDNLKHFAEADQEKAIDFFLDEVIDKLYVELPKPQLTNVRNQMENFRDFKEALEEAFNFVISDDAVSQAMLGESAERIVALRAPLMAQMIRDWMRKENFMPELFDLIEVNEAGEGVSNSTIMVQEHLRKLAINMTKLLRDFVPVSVATTKDLNEIDGTESEPTAEDSNTEAGLGDEMI